MKPSAYDGKKENEVVYKCNISDGPFCSPMDKYYKHSKALYSSVSLEQ